MQAVQQIGEYITIDQISKQLNKTYAQTVYLLKKYKVPMILVGHTRLVKVSDVEFIINQNK